MNVETMHPADESGTLEQLRTADGSAHFIRSYYSKSQKAVVLYLHGIEGHSLWFASSAKVLRSNDITVLALDRRGSGLSKEARGDVRNYKMLLDDTKAALDFASEKACGQPLFFMANCWGAKLAAILCEEQQLANSLSGLILSSPAIEAKVDLPLKDKLTVAWRLLSGNSAPLAIPLEIEDFTDNPEYLEFIKNDTLRLTQATARFYLNTLILTLLSKQSAEKISLPTLLVQSGIDNIVDQAGVQRWFERLKSSDKTFRVFPEAYHSLDFDRQPEAYLDLLLNWINAHCKQSRNQGNTGDGSGSSKTSEGSQDSAGRSQK